MRLIARDVFGLPTLCVCDIRYGFFVFKFSHRIHVKMEKQNFVSHSCRVKCEPDSNLNNRNYTQRTESTGEKKLSHYRCGRRVWKSATLSAHHEITYFACDDEKNGNHQLNPVCVWMCGMRGHMQKSCLMKNDEEIYGNLNVINHNFTRPSQSPADARHDENKSWDSILFVFNMATRNSVGFCFKDHFKLFSATPEFSRGRSFAFCLHLIIHSSWKHGAANNIRKKSRLPSHDVKGRDGSFVVRRRCVCVCTTNIAVNGGWLCASNSTRNEELAQ